MKKILFLVCFAISTSLAFAHNTEPKANTESKKEVVATTEPTKPNTDSTKDECGNETAKPEYWVTCYGEVNGIPISVSVNTFFRGTARAFEVCAGRLAALSSQITPNEGNCPGGVCE